MGADTKIKVGSGKKFNLRVTKDVADAFPDGCRIENVSRVRGGLELALRNRVGSYRFTQDKSGKGQRYTLTCNHEKIVGPRLPQFGSVAAEQVTAVRGGYQVFLPEKLPPLGPAHYTGKKKAPAKPPAPPVAAPEASPAPPPALPLPEAPVAASKPEISLADAVAAVNGWRLFLGGKVVLEVREDGGLRAYAEYE